MIGTYLLGIGIRTTAILSMLDLDMLYRALVGIVGVEGSFLITGLKELLVGLG
jgi:hypothetical protein